MATCYTLYYAVVKTLSVVTSFTLYNTVIRISLLMVTCCILYSAVIKTPLLMYIVHVVQCHDQSIIMPMAYIVH